MTHPANIGGYDVTSYFALVREGVISPEDHVELLEGLIVAAPPQAPYHAATIRRIDRLLHARLGDEVVYSVQMPLIASGASAPEPDLAVHAGRDEDFADRHPTSALLAIEVADASLAADRLTRSRIYAGAGVTNYWIVNLRDHTIEWYAHPDVAARVYRERGIAKGSKHVRLDAFPAVIVRANELLPAE